MKGTCVAISGAQSSKGGLSRSASRGWQVKKKCGGLCCSSRDNIWSRSLSTRQGHSHRLELVAPMATEGKEEAAP